MTARDFIARADDIIARLEVLVGTPATQRQEAVPEELLLGALEGVKRMRDSVKGGNLPRWTLPVNQRGGGLTRLFVDCFDHRRWPTTGKLIEDIEELEYQYVRM